MLEVVGAFERLLARPLPVEVAPRRLGDQPVAVADSAYVRRLLDWRPPLASLDRILETAWRWEQGC